MTRKKMTDKKGELTDTEASFLKGTAKNADEEVLSVPTPKTLTTDTDTPDSIMKQILMPSASREPTTRFTADLPDSLHRRLTIAAAMSGKKKVDIVRELLDASLPQVPQ
jgi:hypothetical protein